MITIHIKQRELWWFLEATGFGFMYNDIGMYNLGMSLVWKEVK